MLIIMGQKLCGRVDQVPDKCYVKTRFLHFYYVPVIPLSSWVIEQGTEGKPEFKAAQIPLCLKSIIFGWLQTGLVIFGAYNALYGAKLMFDHRPLPNNDFDGPFKLILGAMCLITWMLLTVWPYRASDQRAKELTSRLGIPFEINEESYYAD